MKISNLLSLLLVVLTGVSLQAQFDDLYYNPSEESYTYVDTSEEESEESTDHLAYDDAEFDYDEYEYMSDYDNYYSSRIRRFRSPSARTFGYYSGYANNSYVYDPFDTYYNPAYYYNPYRRRSNSLVSVVIGNPGYVYNGYYNPTRRWGYYNPYNTIGGFGRTGFGGSSYGCPVGITTRGVSSSNVRSNAIVANPRGTYIGSRRSGSTSSSVGSTNARRSARTSTTTSAQSRTTRSTARSSSTRPSRSASRSTTTKPSRSTRTYSKPKATSRSTSRSRNSSMFNSGSRSNRSSSIRSSSRSSSRSSGSSRMGGARRGN